MNSQELWQVEVDGRTYEANIEEVIEWISEGSVLPQDKVRRGSLRWLPAERVPELYRHFYPSNFVQPLEVLFESNSVVVTNNVAATVTVKDNPGSFSNLAPADSAEDENNEKLNTISRRFCKKHRDTRAIYTCGTCGDSLCLLCPNRFGNVRLCPSCGGMCLPFTDVDQADRITGALNKPYARKAAEKDELRAFFDTRLSGLEIWTALKWPVRQWRQSLVLATLFVVLIFGAATALIGNLSSLGSAVVSFSCMVGLMFVVLTRVSSNVLTENAGGGLLPDLQADGIRKSLGKPLCAAFFVAIAAFGPFAVLFSAAGGYAWVQFSGSVALVEKEMRSTEAQTARLLNFEQAKAENQRFEQRLSTKRDELLNSVLGRDSFNDNPAIDTAVQSLMRLSVLFLLPAGLAFVFGLVMFPACCANAIDGDSVRRILNPLAALSMLRRTGFDYFKLLFISIIAIIAATAVAAGLFLAGSAVSSPAFGFAAALMSVGAISSYFWAVFSRLLSVTVHT